MNYNNNYMEKERARRIVKLAAKKVTKQSRQWLTLDENGFWENEAIGALRKTAEKAQELGLSETQVDAEIATLLAMMATEAALRAALKKPKKKAR